MAEKHLEDLLFGAGELGAKYGAAPGDAQQSDALRQRQQRKRAAPAWADDDGSDGEGDSGGGSGAAAVGGRDHSIRRVDISRVSRLRKLRSAEDETGEKRRCGPP